MAYIYPLNNPGGVHLTVFDFTHLSHPPTIRFRLTAQLVGLIKLLVSQHRGEGAGEVDGEAGEEEEVGEEGEIGEKGDVGEEGEV